MCVSIETHINMCLHRSFDKYLHNFPLNNSLIL